MKEANDECDLGLQALLLKYAATLEDAILGDATLISPLQESGPSLKRSLSSIDNEKDFRDYFAKLLTAAARIERNNNCMEAGQLGASASSIDAAHIFAVPLTVLFEREHQQVPAIVAKCTEAVEEYGKATIGIYRSSGSTARVQRLKALFDVDPRKVNLHDAEWRNDIASITATLKLFFRELPDPLLTDMLYMDFIKAARTYIVDAVRLYYLHL